MKVTIHHGFIEHSEGFILHAAASHESLVAWAAEYCRKSWDRHFDKNDLEDAIPETDEQIVEMFFDRAAAAGFGDGEYFLHDCTEVEIPS